MSFQDSNRLIMKYNKIINETEYKITKILLLRHFWKDNFFLVKQYIDSRGGILLKQVECLVLGRGGEGGGSNE